MRKTYKMFAGLLVVMLVAFSGQAMAQSTIFNIPTTDVVAKGKAYAEFDFLPQAPAPAGSRTYIYNPRLVVGAPGNIEIGVNFPTYNTRATAGSSTQAFFQPNIKWKMYNNDDAGVAVAGGGIFVTPLNNTDAGFDSFGFVYGNLSKKVKSSDYGPRFTIGPYGIASGGTKCNVDSPGGTCWVGAKAGVIAGYEQPVHAKVSIVADWISGKNGFGYFTPGVSFTLPGSGLLNAGYSLGNDSWKDTENPKNKYFFVYYGVTF